MLFSPVTTMWKLSAMMPLSFSILVILGLNATMPLSSCVLQALGIPSLADLSYLENRFLFTKHNIVDNMGDRKRTP